MTVCIADLMNDCGVRFGTSGARGLVSAMTDRVCYAYTRAFLQMLIDRGEVSQKLQVALAGDRRSSSPRIMNAVAQAAFDLGFDVINGGLVPSPAIAMYGLNHRIPSIMVTGSHIPDDRNGIKFNKTTGEILKSDEAAMLAQVVDIPEQFSPDGSLLIEGALGRAKAEPLVAIRYVQRWVDAFKSSTLKGKKIVVYGHSAVGRDILVEVMGALGADVVRANWSETFVPVDTEAIRDEDVKLARELAKQHSPFAIVSTDGDSDRPLISDENGEWLRGDVLGVLVASWLKADAVVTPVSCNTVVERVGKFKSVVRTRIGSPYVIAGMCDAVAQGLRRVVGYEANGGFLTATDMELPWGSVLPALPTRDAIIAQLAVMVAATERNMPISRLVGSLPPRFTASDRLQSFSSTLSQSHLEALATGGNSMIDEFLGDLIGKVINIDTTDGVRIAGDTGEIVHLRGSGNAPELRCYAEAATPERARMLTVQALACCASWRD